VRWALSRFAFGVSALPRSRPLMLKYLDELQQATTLVETIFICYQYQSKL